MRKISRKILMFGLFYSIVFCLNAQKTDFRFLDKFIINYDENTLFSDTSNLFFWEKELENKQIVLLGELGHTDGSTFLLKTEIIKFLHSKLGYDILFLESADYAYFNNPSIDDSVKNNKQSCFLNWNSLWSYTDQLKELYLYLEKCSSTNPLNLLSCDVQSNKIPFVFLPELKQYLSETNYQEHYKINWDVMMEITEICNDTKKDIYTLSFENKITDQQWQNAKDNLTSLTAILNIYENKLKDKNKNRFYQQCLANGIHDIENLLIYKNTNDVF